MSQKSKTGSGLQQEHASDEPKRDPATEAEPPHQGSSNEPPGRPPHSWRDIHEQYEDVPDRLGGQKGYRLFDGSVMPSLSPHPRLKPEVDLILNELEKPAAERNHSILTAGMERLPDPLLAKAKKMPDPSSLAYLLEGHDPRFGHVGRDLQRELFRLFHPGRGRPKSEDRCKAEVHIADRLAGLKGRLENSPRSLVIESLAEKIFGASPSSQQNKAVRVALAKYIPPRRRKERRVRRPLTPPQT